MLKNHSDLDDPRVGVRAVSPVPEPPLQHPTSPQPEGDRERAHRNYYQQLLDIVLLEQIDGQISRVGSFCRNVGCQRLIAALGNFRRKYNKAKQLKAC